MLTKHLIMGVLLGTGAIIYQFIYLHVINNLFSPNKKIQHWILQWVFICSSFSMFSFLISQNNNMYFAIGIYFITGLVVFSTHFLIDPLFDLNNADKVRDGSENLLEIKKYNVNLFVYDKYKLNAYATGVFKGYKNILIHKDIYHGDKQVLQSIVLHELGHLKNNHLLKLYFLSAASYVVGAFVFKYQTILFPLYHENGSPNVISVMIVGGSIGLTQYYFPRLFQKRMEHQADLFAAKLVGVEHYENALKELDKLSEGRVSKGAITHPDMESRIKYLKNKLSQ